MRKSISWIYFIGVFGMPLALITKPRTKYLREGDDGTIAACFEYTLTPVFRSDIRWYQINATTMTQIPKSNMHSEVWSAGYVLKATNVKAKNSGNYCCLVEEMEACTENSTTQLIVAVTPQLTIRDPMMSATHGGSAQMTCDHANPDTIPIRVRWYKNGALLFTGEKYTIGVIQQTHSYTLQVHNVTENDEGAYNCIADSVHSSQSVGTIHLIVISATTSSPVSVTTTASSSNLTTEQPSRNTANQSTTTSMLVTLVTFPADIKCELSKLITVDDDLQVYLMNLCNCTNIMIHSVSFECINDSMATYSFLITGERAIEIAKVFNHSLNNQKDLITANGVSFSLHSPLQNSTSSMSTIDDDSTSDTVHLNIFAFLGCILIIAVAIILIVGLSVGMYACWKKSKGAELKKNLNLNNQHEYENIAAISHRRIYPINYATAV